MLKNSTIPVYGYLILSALVFAQCEKEVDLNIPVPSPRLVVEGWIENGKAAEVILSQSAPYFSTIDSSNIRDFAVTHAKVTLLCEGDREILTLTPNKAYFPPYVYKSVRIKGETGREYSLEIILDGDTITCTTRIPEPVKADSVWFQSDPRKTGQGRIWIRATDPVSMTNFYRILYKRKGKDGRYLPGNFSTFSDILFNGRTIEMGFLRGYSSLLTSDEENYFVTGDTVSVKFSSIDEEEFNFWNGYQNAVLAAANPLASGNVHMHSNVNGGLGIWTGYGSTYYLVICRDQGPGTSD
jgi:hypothetical protein